VAKEKGPRKKKQRHKEKKKEMAAMTWFWMTLEKRKHLPSAGSTGKVMIGREGLRRDTPTHKIKKNPAEGKIGPTPRAGKDTSSVPVEKHAHVEARKEKKNVMIAKRKTSARPRAAFGKGGKTIPPRRKFRRRQYLSHFEENRAASTNQGGGAIDLAPGKEKAY